jgi:cytoplasmic iron level regulating protein YaaA (DUF328/UPF0246 family)
VFILLPPSEAKVDGGDGSAIRFSGPLATARQAVLTEAASLCARDPAAAMTALQLPPGELADACVRNAEVFSSPTLPALDRYCGVVYQGLGAASLSAAARRVADESIVIFSGGLGVVRADEPVPWYRIPASARLPELGTVGSVWRPVLVSYLPSLFGSGFVVDLRSTDYASLWKPPSNALVVRVLQRRGTGGDQVISFHSKLVKGQLARALVQSIARRGRIDSAAAVARVADRIGLEVRPTRTGLDLIDPTPLTGRTA